MTKYFLSKTEKKRLRITKRIFKNNNNKENLPHQIWNVWQIYNDKSVADGSIINRKIIEKMKFP